MQPLPMLSRSFHGTQNYRSNTYRLLPFRMLRWDADRFFLTNLAGEYLILGAAALQDLVHHRLPADGQEYQELKARRFLEDDVSDAGRELLAAQYRTQHDHLKQFTALHIFVVTLRCDHSCPYCQVSRVSQDRAAFDMSGETADQAIGLMFKSPSPVLKIEFQGGESLLNFDLIRHIVLECERRNDGRTLEFVIATNLSPLTDEILSFCADHRVGISTSLDGPEPLHNRNRPRPGGDSYQKAVEGIERAREALGHEAVSALMTTTLHSLKMAGEIVDEYARLKFSSIFIRPLSPFGFAVRSSGQIGYETRAFLGFYSQALARILELNRNGIPFREEFASTVLRKALTPFPTGYVDLQSPAGMGTSVLVYNYDGDVYASDEGRMLAETGDFTFRLGNVHRDSYESIMLDSPLLPMLYDTMLEATPGCCDCAFLPWCGADPVYHHATQGDPTGYRPTSGFCQRNMGIFRLLVETMEADPGAKRTMRGWAQW